MVRLLKSKNHIFIFLLLAMFVGSQHQDAHEFLHFLLNEFSERINEENRSEESPENWIETLFEGVLTNKTQCLRCDSITSRDEKVIVSFLLHHNLLIDIIQFLDLSINIANHSSLSFCLREFGRREFLSRDCKFRCSECLSLQEAHKVGELSKSASF
jgi:ubiquitin carboxyl-terminal hydrolase 9/13